MENGKPVDVSGHYDTRAGSTAQFAGARGLAAFLANSEESKDAFEKQMFQQFVKQPVLAYGLEKPVRLRETFAQGNYNIRKLMVDIAVIVLHNRRESPRFFGRTDIPVCLMSFVFFTFRYVVLWDKLCVFAASVARINNVVPKTKRLRGAKDKKDKRQKTDRNVLFLPIVLVPDRSPRFLESPCIIMPSSVHPRSRPQRRRHSVRPEPEPGMAFANQQKRKQRIIFMFSPNGIVRKDFWPDEEGSDFKLKEILSPLKPFQDKLLVLNGLCDKVRGDGDGHMRGIGCLLTGIELFPGNIQGGSDTPAGWSMGISIDQELKNFLQKEETTRTRFGSLEFGVMVPERADTWTRWSYSGPNKPIAPIDDPYQMFAKTVRPCERPGRRLKSRAGRREGRSGKSGCRGRPGRSATACRARDLRPGDGRGTQANPPGGQPPGAGAGAGRSDGQRPHPADQQAADRPDGPLLRG